MGIALRSRSSSRSRSIDLSVYLTLTLTLQFCFLYYVTLADPDPCDSVRFDKKPELGDLGVVDLGATVNAHCKAVVGKTGTLYVTITPFKTELHGMERYYLNDSALARLVQDDAIMKGRTFCGKNSSAFLELRAEVKYHNALFQCCRTDPWTCSAAQSLIVNIPEVPQRLTLAPKHPEEGESATLRCTAYPGTDGILSWSIDYRGGDLELKVDREGNLWKLTRPYPQKHLLAWRKSVFGTMMRNTPLGPKLESTIVFNMTKDLHDAKVKCSSVRDSKVKLATIVLQLYPGCNDSVYATHYPCKYDEFRDVEPERMCVRFMDKLESWEEARETCESNYQADLVIVENARITRMLLGMGPKSSTTPYWIGLRHTPENETFYWVDDDTPAHYFNWETGEPKPTGEDLDCVKVDPGTGLWSLARCSDKYHFICQKISARNPGKPTVQLAFPYATTHAYVGMTLKAICSTLLDRTGKIKFRLAAAGGGGGGGPPMEEIEENDKRLIYGAVTEFVKKGKTCSRMRKAVLVVEVPSWYADGTISCCWYTRDGFSRCSDTLPFQTYYAPHIPVVNPDKSADEISLVGKSFMSAQCSAFVGTGGHLMWTLHMPSRPQTSKYAKGTGTLGAYNDATATEIHGDTMIIWQVMMVPNQGPLVNSTIKTRVSGDLEGASLACTAYFPHDVELNKHKTVYTPKFTVKANSKEFHTDVTRTSYLVPALLAAAFGILVVYFLKIHPRKEKMAPEAGTAKSSRASVAELSTSAVASDLEDSSDLKSRRSNIRLDSGRQSGRPNPPEMKVRS